MSIKSLVRDGTSLFVAAAVLLLSVDIYLAHTNRVLAARLTAAEDSLHQSISAQIGALATTIRGYDLSRHRVEVGFAPVGQATAVFVFSPNCPSCDDIWPMWTSYVNQLDRAKWRIVAVDPTQLATREYVSGKLPSDVTVVASPDTESIINFPLRLTPQLIVVSPTGHVESVWTGAPQKLGRAGIDAIARRFGVRPMSSAVSPARP